MQCSVFIPAGTPAPFDGILYTPRRSARETFKAYRCDFYTAEAVSKVQEAADKLLKDTEERHVMKIEGCRKETGIVWGKFEKAVDRAPPVWAYAAGGFVVGAVLAAWVISSAH